MENAATTSRNRQTTGSAIGGSVVVHSVGSLAEQAGSGIWAVAKQFAVPVAAVAFGLLPARSSGTSQFSDVETKQRAADGSGTCKKVEQVEGHQQDSTRRAVKQRGYAQFVKSRLVAEHLIAGKGQRHGKWGNEVGLRREEQYERCE